MRKSIIKTNVIVVIILVVLASLLISTTNASKLENNTVDVNNIEITLSGTEQTFVIEEVEGIFQGYLEEDPEKKHIISEGFNLTIFYEDFVSNNIVNIDVSENNSNINNNTEEVDKLSNVTENNIVSYNFNLQLNFEGDLYFGNINANLVDETKIGNFNIQGSGNLHLEKPAVFGNNNINISKTQVFAQGLQIKAKSLTLIDNAKVEIRNSVGTGPSILVESVVLDNSVIKIDSENGIGIEVKQLDEKNANTLVFNIKNKSSLEVLTGSDGVIIGDGTTTAFTDINDSVLTIEGKFNESQTIGLFSTDDINVTNSKIYIKKHQNGISSKNLNAKNSEINIDTQQKNISDAFGTGVQTSSAINMDNSNLNITSPLDIGYQNNVQALWAKEINLRQKSNITENYVGAFHVSADTETDIYYNGGLGSQMSDIENYEIKSKNDLLVYNKETKKFLSEAVKQQNDELVFERDKSKANEKINIGANSTHKIVIPVSLETIAPLVVEFNTNGGSAIPAQKVLQGETAAKPESLLKAGFDFDAWYIDSELSKVFDFSTAINSNVVLHASWAVELPKINFDTNGGAFKEGIANNIIKTDSNKIDISFYTMEENLPVKSGYYFAGWMDESGALAADSVMIGEKSITLVAKWEAYENLLNLEHSKPITEYKNIVTENDINQRVNTFVKYVSVSGKEIEVPVFYEWNTSIINIGGITEARPYILDPNTSEKVYGDNIYNIDIYILNKPYIRSRKNVMLNIQEKVSIDGREWQAVGILELPDFSSKRITRTTFPVIYNGSHVNTFDEGTYNVYFSGHTNTITGENINVETENIMATVSKIDTLNAKFWITAGEETKKLRKNNFNTINLNNNTVEKEQIQGKSDFDRSMVINPGEHTVMLNGFLSNLSKHKNAMVRIDMGENQWDLYSKNFKDEFVSEKVDLSVKNTDNIGENIKEYLSDLEYKALYFGLDSDWGGEAIFRTKVNFENENSNIYMFNWNENTDELELVGQMARDNDGYYSVKINKANGTYIITNGLPKPKVNEINPLDGNQVSVFRITEQTGTMDENAFNTIKKTVEEYGVNINHITLVQPQVGQFDDSVSQEIRDRQIVAGILLTIVFILAIIVVVNRIMLSKRKRKILVESASMGVATAINPEISFGVRLENQNKNRKNDIGEEKTKPVEEPYTDIVEKVAQTKENVDTMNINRKTLLEKNRDIYYQALEKISPELVNSVNAMDPSVQNGNCPKNGEVKETIISINKDVKQDAAVKALKSRIKLGNKSKDNQFSNINAEDTLVHNTQKSILARFQNDYFKQKEKINIKKIKKDEKIKKIDKAEKPINTINAEDNNSKNIAKINQEQKNTDNFEEKLITKKVYNFEEDTKKPLKEEVSLNLDKEILGLKNKIEPDIVHEIEPIHVKEETSAKVIETKSNDKKIEELNNVENTLKEHYENMAASKISKRVIKPKTSDDKKPKQQRVYRQNSRLDYEKNDEPNGELGKTFKRKSRLVKEENLENEEVKKPVETISFEDIKKDVGHNILKENSQTLLKGKVNLNEKTEYQKHKEGVLENIEVEMFRVDEDF